MGNKENSLRYSLVETISSLRYDPKETIERDKLNETTIHLIESVKRGEIIDFMIIPFMDAGGVVNSRLEYSVFVKKFSGTRA